MTHARRVVVGTFLCCSALGFALGAGVQVWAQVRTAPAPSPAPAAPVPTLSEDDTLLVQTVQQLGKVAADACQGLATVKTYNTQRQAVSTHLETKYPGFTLDWSSRTLTATK